MKWLPAVSVAILVLTTVVGIVKWSYDARLETQQTIAAMDQRLTRIEVKVEYAEARMQVREAPTQAAAQRVIKQMEGTLDRPRLEALRELITSRPGFDRNGPLPAAPR